MPSRSKSPKPAVKPAAPPKPADATPPKTTKEDNQEILDGIARNTASQPANAVPDLPSDATIVPPQPSPSEATAPAVAEPASTVQPGETVPSVVEAAPQLIKQDLPAGETPVAAIPEVVQDKPSDLPVEPVQAEIIPASVEEAASAATTGPTQNANISGASITLTKAAPLPSEAGILEEESSPSVAEVPPPAPIEAEALGLVGQAAEN